MTAPSPTPPGSPSALVTRADAVASILEPPTWSPDERPNIGDNFVVTEKLGEGGFAVVWKARDRSILRRRVAVKILSTSNPDTRRRFLLEAELVANINHPNVARAYSSGVTADGRPFVVLELVEGENLGYLLDTKGPLPWREAVEIGIQVSAALEALHSKGVIHRDVKPANVMLTRDDAGKALAKLIDFGIARVTEAYVDPAMNGFTKITPREPTKEGLALGTPGYMPWEAGLGVPDYSFDVYGLAATLYQLCTGHKPSLGPLDPFSELQPPIDAPADLSTVLGAALALEPSDRTQTAKEFGRGLVAVCAAHPKEKNSILFDGRYERIALLGTGAKGEVFLANHRGTSQDVALKTLRALDPDNVNRFQREGSLLRFLDHPCIPRFFDLALHCDPPYLAMAHAAGVPAVTFCGVKGRLTATEVLHVGWQLADALAYIHKLGIIHRDIHASNVLIHVERASRIGNSRVQIPRAISVSLVDFGCAEFTAGHLRVDPRRYRTPPEARVRIPDGKIHTLNWAAPEAKAGRGFTEKSDVYSLGLLLFRLVTGRVPTEKQRMQPLRASSYAECPNDLDMAIQQALNPEPDKRPSAEMLVATFEDAFAADKLLDEELRQEQDRMLESEGPDSASDDGPLAVVLPLRKPQSLGPLHKVGGWTTFSVVQQAPREDTADTPAAPVDTPPTEAAVEAAEPRTSAAPDHPFRRHSGWLVVGALLACAWLGGRATAPAIVPVVLEDAEVIIPPVVPSPAMPTPPPPSAPALLGTVSPMPVSELPSMREVLDGVKDRLTACSKKAGGHLLIEFRIAGGRDSFAAVTLPTQRDAAIAACVQDATAGLRFRPQADLTFTREF